MLSRSACFRLGHELLRFLVALIVLSLLVGSSVALFLVLLDLVTHLHWACPWLLFALPAAGGVTWWMYQAINKDAEGGNSLIFDRIRHPHESPNVPLSMVPLVFLGTLITHLFGGSAGREGTAVQMGGGISRCFSLWVGQNDVWQRALLLCGVSAGFGAVFGTPVAGAAFAVEVIWLGRIGVLYFVPCLFTAYLAHFVAMRWGIDHTAFHLPSLAIYSPAAQSISAEQDFSLMSSYSWLKIILAAIVFGWISLLFAKANHGVNRQMKRWIRKAWLRPVIGASVLILITMLLGTRDYLGLGVDLHPNQSRTVCIASSFEAGGVDPWSWLWKLVSTALTVGSGFKGGEVTPLFFIGASAGNVIGQWLKFPVDLMAALGFVAVFAGATKTPIACTLMAMELFLPTHPELISSGFALQSGVVCLVSRIASGRSSIYRPAVSSSTSDRAESASIT